MKTTLKLGSLLLLLGGSVISAFGADNTTAIEYFNQRVKICKELCC